MEWTDETELEQTRRTDTPVECDFKSWRGKAIQYLVEFEVAVCSQCGYGLHKPPGIRRHLMSRHMYDRRDAKRIEDGFQGLKIRSLTDQRAREPMPEDSPVPYVKLYEDGLKCNLCHYICWKETSMLQHLWEAHGMKKVKQRMVREKMPQLSYALDILLGQLHP